MPIGSCYVLEVTVICIVHFLRIVVCLLLTVFVPLVLIEDENGPKGGVAVIIGGQGESHRVYLLTLSIGRSYAREKTVGACGFQGREHRRLQRLTIGIGICFYRRCFRKL